MTPTLHEWYSLDEAIAAFGDDGAFPELLCDGQFVMLPKFVLGFITLSHSTQESHLPAPTAVTWRPARLDYDPADSQTPWLPERVREVYDRKGERVVQLREHHLFLRAGDDDRYLYAGPVQLGCIHHGEKDRAADFSLDHKLPREAWLRFGGYAGWQIEVNHKSYRLDAGDTKGFEKLIRSGMRKRYSHIGMTRYEGDSLSLHTNPERGWLMYLRHPSDSGLYTRDLEYSGPKDAEEIFVCVCGIDLEFPANQTLPRDAACRLAVELFRTGKVPESIRWEKG